MHGFILLNIIALAFWLFQIIFAFLNFRKQKKTYKELDYIPNVSVIIPTYNEIEQNIINTIESVVRQKKVNVEIFIIDDGSFPSLDIPIYNNVQILRLPTNYGKRYAQMKGIENSSYDLIVTVDSDTILEDDAIYELCKSAETENFDAVTGVVYLQNEKENILTRMIASIYWFGFFQERSAQSFWGKVTCCSGAISLYKKQYILNVKELYLNQNCFGAKCNAGDDRFLTCLFAIQGCKTGCSLNSKVKTISPTTLFQFIKQQVRWTRSYMPALVFMLKNFNKCSTMFLFLMSRTIFRYVYFLYIFYCVVIGLSIGNWYWIHALIFIEVICAIKSLIAWFYTREMKFLWLLPMGLLAFLMAPILLYGVITPTSTSWLTRKKRKTICKIQKDIV